MHLSIRTQRRKLPPDCRHVPAKQTQIRATLSETSTERKAYIQQKEFCEEYMERVLARACLPIVLCVAGSAYAGAVAEAAPQPAGQVNCRDAYGGKPNQCVRVPCSGSFQPFIGTWAGPFWSYMQKESAPGKPVFRPYRNVIVYTGDSCLKNSGTGETFIVGRETDDYPAFRNLPAKTEHSLLITGTKAGGELFLRTVSSEGAYDYSLVYKNSAANLAVWKLRVPGANGNPEMNFTIIDGRDFTAAESQARFVEVTLAVGPEASPFWEGPVSYGRHSKQ